MQGGIYALKFLLLGVRTEKVTRFVHIGRDGNVEKSDHHFIVRLIAPANRHVRIWIVRIVFRIVVPRDSLKHNACVKWQRMGEAITQLPIKIIIYAQEGLRGAAGMKDVVFEALAAEVHVREEA